MDAQTHNDNNTDNVYKMSKSLFVSLLIMAIFSFFLGFIFNFSLEDKIISLIETNVKYNKRCPIHYKKLNIGFFFPSINMANLNISSKCIRSEQDISLKKVKTSLGFPSFSPMGVSLQTNIQDNFSQVKISSVHSFNKNYFKINSKKFSAKSISPILKNFKLAGNFNLDTNIGLNKKNIEKLSLKIESKNFSIPSQNLQGFDIPNLNLGDLLLKATIKNKNVLDIQELIIGREISAIRAKVTGAINLDKYNVANSNIDLIATVKFSEAFLDSFSIINLLLSSAQKDGQGFYKMKLTGKLSRPDRPQFLNP